MCGIGLGVAGVSMAGPPDTHPGYSPGLSTPGGAAYVRFNVRGWVFAPAVVDGYIFGFLAWANTVDPAEDSVIVTGENLRVLWCQRDEQAWSVWAWTGDDVGQAATWVRGLLDAPAAFAEDLQLPSLMDQKTGAVPLAPHLLYNGLLRDDPLQALLSSAASPEVFVDAVAKAGYRAAPVVSALHSLTTSGACDPTANNALEGALDGLTQEADTILFGRSQFNTGCSWPCKCTTTSGPATAGAWGSNSTVIGSRRHCVYHRQWSVLVTKTGLHWWCTSCAGSYTMNTQCESASEDHELSDPCGSAPQSTTATTFTNGTCASF
jgi:hypothetical protein